MKHLKTHLLACLLLPQLAVAQPYDSEFGFRTEVTDNWLIVSRRTLQDNPDLTNFESAGLQEFDRALVLQIKQMASSGQFELLYYLKSDDNFRDNINLFISNPSHSDLGEMEGQLCGSLQAGIRQAYKRNDHTTVYHCERRQIAAVDMINYSFDGAVLGSRSYGYLFNAAPGSITLTVTCKNAKCAEVVSDAEVMFRNMQF